MQLSPEHRYRDLNTYLQERFGCRVHKITIDAGLSCPNRDGTIGSGGCIYCNPRGSGTGLAETHSITAQIQRVKGFLRKRFNAEKYIAYFQSYTNTYAPVERLRELYGEALADDDIVGLAVGTRPDCVPDRVLDLLAECNERTWLTVEYGLQSIRDRTLRLINRGHTAADFREAAARTRARGIDVTAHVILGLPGESREDMLATIDALNECGVRGVKFHLLYVVKNTVLHRMLLDGEYRCLERDRYIELLGDCIARLDPGIVVHRLTGDPHADEFVAPAWTLDKNTVLNHIRRSFGMRGIIQGRDVATG